MRRPVLTALAAIALAGGAGIASAAWPDPASIGDAQWRARAPAFAGPWVAIAPARALRTAAGKAPPIRPGVKLDATAAAQSLHKCLPPGVPRILTHSGPFRLAVGKSMVAIQFQEQHLFRPIYVDENHFEGIGPAYSGQSVAKWEGDTLVVDTSDFNDLTFLDDAGLPHGDKLHVVERYRVLPGGQLEVRARIDDPATFTSPWETVMRFRRIADRPFAEDYCLRRNGMLGDTAK